MSSGIPKERFKGLGADHSINGAKLVGGRGDRDGGGSDYHGENQPKRAAARYAVG